MPKLQPLCLIAGFRRAQEIGRVIDVALGSGLDVVVSLDRPSDDRGKWSKDWEEVVRVAHGYPALKDLWQYDSPLGCARHLQTAVSRAFSESEDVIILEDDTLPSPYFFQYCQDMLAAYRDNAGVGMICGSRHVPRTVVDGRFLSHWPIIWGWAAWRRTWDAYEPKVDLREYDLQRIRCMLPPGFPDSFARWLRFDLQQIEQGSLDTWDIQLAWSMLKRRQLSLYPSANLVTNIGVPGASASNKRTFDHSLFRPRYLDEQRKNQPSRASIAANQWHAQWVTHSYLFELQAQLIDPSQVASSAVDLVNTPDLVNAPREIRFFYRYYLPCKIRCAELLKRLRIYGVVHAVLRSIGSLLRKCRALMRPSE